MTASWANIRWWLLVLLVPCAVVADERGEVEGIVQDSTGAVLVSAAITMMDESNGIRRTTRTDGEGVYDIDALRPGLYKITVRRPGFRTIVRLNVKVRPGSSQRFDFVMQVGDLREVVTVEGGAPAMNTADASIGTLLRRDAIEKLPLNGRGIAGLVDLSPGVVTTPAASGEAGQFSANGLRTNTNYLTLDGLSANTGVSGAGLPAQFAGNTLPAMTAFGSTQNLASLESLDEVRILTSSFAPEFGRLPGVQVALTTRSGSDDYHGSFYGAFRNQVLNANDWFANAFGVNRAPARLEQWGATLGGPIRRQRTYFFLSYEGLQMLDSHAWLLTTVPRESRASAPPSVQPLLDAYPVPFGESGGVGLGLVTRPSRLDAGSLRLDHALTDRISIFGRYNQAPSSTESGYAQVERFQLQSSSVTLGVTALAARTTTNDIRIGIWRIAADSVWNRDPAAGGRPIDLGSYLQAPSGSGPAFYGAAIGGIGKLVSGSTGRNRQGEWNVVETLASNGAQHSWRVGADYERLTPVRESAAQSVTGVWNNLADVLALRPPTITSGRAEQASGLIENLSVFAQDTYRPFHRLSITYGLRWELTPPPALGQPAAVNGTPGPGTTSGINFAAPISPPNLPLQDLTQPAWRTSYAQFAPRVGVALRLDDHSVVRLGWGLFYDVGFGVALDPINGFPFNRWQFSTTGGAAPMNGGPALGPRVEKGLRLPYAAEWNVSYERALTARNLVSLSYVGSSGHRLLRREGQLGPGSRLALYEAATNNGSSAYQSLQLEYRRRMGTWLQGTASYTWAHSIDNGSSDSSVYLGYPQTSDRGSSTFDVRHNFTAGLTFSSRRSRSSAPLRDWDLSGMVRARSGFPIDVLTTENLLGVGFDDLSRPNRIPGVPVWIADSTIGGRRLNPSAFAVSSDLQGTLGRNAIPGFGMTQLDLALQRSVPLPRSARLELRIEAFNLLNHVNPADPVRFLDSPLFGRSPSTLNLMLGTGTARSGVAPAFQIGGPRTVQLTLRLQF